MTMIQQGNQKQILQNQPRYWKFEKANEIFTCRAEKVSCSAVRLQESWNDLIQSCSYGNCEYVTNLCSQLHSESTAGDGLMEYFLNNYFKPFLFFLCKLETNTFRYPIYCPHTYTHCPSILWWKTHPTHRVLSKTVSKNLSYHSCNFIASLLIVRCVCRVKLHLPVNGLKFLNNFLIHMIFNLLFEPDISRIRNLVLFLYIKFCCCSGTILAAACFMLEQLS